MISFLAFCIVGSRLTLDQTWSNSGVKGAAMVINNRTRWQSKFTYPGLDDRTKLPICSVTKLMTAQIILQLIDEQKIKLDDAVGNYLPSLPDWTHSITVRQLLTHTSGIQSMDASIPADADGNAPIYFSTRRDLVNLPSRINFIAGPEPKAAAGKSFIYNNTDFLILQSLAEKQTNHSFAQLLQKRIFAKAGMNESSLAPWGSLPASVLRSAELLNGTLVPENRFNFGIFGGAGGVISTLDDIAKWLMWTMDQPEKSSPVAFGSQFGGFQGFGGYAYASDLLGESEPVYERPGAIANYSWQVSILPNRHLAIVVFSPLAGSKLGNFFEKSGATVDLAKLAVATLTKSSN